MLLTPHPKLVDHTSASCLTRTVNKDFLHGGKTPGAAEFELELLEFFLGSELPSLMLLRSAELRYTNCRPIIIGVRNRPSFFAQYKFTVAVIHILYIILYYSIESNIPEVEMKTIIGA